MDVKIIDVEVPKPPKKVVITLSEHEARILKTILYYVGGDFNEELVTPLHKLLYNNGINSNIPVKSIKGGIPDVCFHKMY